MMKYLTIIIISILVGCGLNLSVGYITETKVNPVTGEMESVTYSPYFEYEYRTPDKNLLVRLVVSLGPERVPEEYQHTGVFADDLQRSYRDGIVDWVSEIYFINTSNFDAEVSPTYIKVGNDDKEFSNLFTIASSEWKITEPLITLSSNYGTKVDVEFKFTYKGKEYHIQGIAKRLTTEQIENKYSR